MINGAVSFRPGTVEEWSAAQVNYPMTTGDHLWTDNGATAELHVGSTAIRMDHNTALSVVNLNDQIIQLSVTAGAVQVHVRYLGPNENIEVDTPNAAAMLLRTGDYRVNSDGDNNVTIVAVRQGDAEVTAGPRPLNIPAGQAGRIAGTDQVTADMMPLAPSDGFDNWCRQRDQREDRAVQSARYVPREMVGYEDLDGYGVWTESPQWGMVWRPTGMIAGWAPYRHGHWAWVSPWGWTWVDEAPWGFAPFHYGRWANYGGGWVWIPGAVTARPVYSPALVAFVGGGGFAIGVGGGAAAWFALGPGEVYRPAYHVSEVYVRNVNVAYVSNVTVINRVGPVTYVNQGVVGGVTVVPQAAFVGGRPIAAAVVVVPREQIIGARVVGYTAPMAPERASIVGYAGAGVVVRTPPAVIESRVVMARNAPPPPPVSFAAQQNALRANGGRPLAPQQVESYRPAEQRYNPQVRQVGAPQTFGRPNAGAPQPQGQGPGQNRPQNNAPPMYRNDRPPAAQPQNPGQTVTPAAPRGATPNNPVQQEARPVTPATTPATNNQPSRPANEVRPGNENRPAEVRGEGESKAPPQKGAKKGNDKTVKKEEKKN